MEQTGIQGQGLDNTLRHARLPRGMAFGIIIVTALLAFEIFNYSTTDYALSDLLGELSFFGVRWATILAIAFCGIDFAGIARLFTPEEGAEEPGEVWYLFGAWLLAATMNAMLTWWGVSLAVLNQSTLGEAVIERSTLLRVVPIFVAVLVWLIRVLIIGTFSVAGERLFSQSERRVDYEQRAGQQPRQQPVARPSAPAAMPVVRSLGNRQQSSPRPIAAAAAPAQTPTPVAAPVRPAPKPVASAPQIPAEGGYSRPEPTYTSLMSAAPNGQNGSGEGRSSENHPIGDRPSYRHVRR